MKTKSILCPRTHFLASALVLLALAFSSTRCDAQQYYSVYSSFPDWDCNVVAFWAFASISSDVYNNIDAYGTATSEKDTWSPCLSDATFTLSIGTFSAFSDTFETDGEVNLSEEFYFGGLPSTTYSMEVEGDDCYLGVCWQVVDASVSLTTPASSGSGGSPPTISAIYPTSGTACDTNLPLFIYGENLAPLDNSTNVATYPPYPIFAFQPSSITDTEIDGTYSIDCNAGFFIGYVVVNTSGGSSNDSPDFNIYPY